MINIPKSFVEFINQKDKYALVFSNGISELALQQDARRRAFQL